MGSTTTGVDNHLSASQDLTIFSAVYLFKTNNMKKLPNIHPGEVLLEEFLVPLGISAYKLSKDIEIPQTRTSEIIKGRRRITADTALRLSQYFGTTAKFWLGLQNDYDLEEERVRKPQYYEKISGYKENAA